MRFWKQNPVSTLKQAIHKVMGSIVQCKGCDHPSCVFTWLEMCLLWTFSLMPLPATVSLWLSGMRLSYLLKNNWITLSFCLFVKSTDAVQKGFVVELLRSVHRTEWTKMWNRLHHVDLHFRYQHPTQPDDAVNMVWKSISHKVPSVKFLLHKRNRYKRSKRTSFSAQLWISWIKYEASGRATLSVKYV